MSPRHWRIKQASSTLNHDARMQNLVASNVPASRKPRSLTLIYAGIQVLSLLSCSHIDKCSSLDICVHSLCSCIMLPAHHARFFAELSSRQGLSKYFFADAFAAVQSGTIVSLIAAPLIIRESGWPAVFYIFGAIGFFWLTAWQPLAKDSAHAPALATTTATAGTIADGSQAAGGQQQGDNMFGSAQALAARPGRYRGGEVATSGREPESQAAATSGVGRDFDFRSVCIVSLHCSAIVHSQEI